MTPTTLRSHPFAPLDPWLAKRQLARAADLDTNGRLVRQAGIVMLRQQPAMPNGTMFISLEDETREVQVIVWKSLRQKQRPGVLRSWLLAVFAA